MINHHRLRAFAESPWVNFGISLAIYAAVHLLFSLYLRLLTDDVNTLPRFTRWLLGAVFGRRRRLMV